MKNPLRILVVYPYLHHYRRAVFTELDRDSRFEFTFVSDIQGSHGIPSFDPSNLKRHIRVRTIHIFHLTFQPQLLRVLKKGNYDQVIFLGDVYSPSTWLAAWLCKKKGIKTYMWTIGWHRPEQGIRSKVRLAFYRISDGLMLYGNVGRTIGIQLGFPEEKMHVIGNSIGKADSIDAGQIFGQNEIDDKAIYVGAVARINFVKRFDLLVEAVALLRNSGLDIRVILVGAGAEKYQLIKQAQDLAVPLLVKPSLYSDEQLSQVYEVLSITVVPAAVGLTAIQSVRFGTPVISNDDMYGQMPEWEAIIHGSTGAQYTKGDPSDLATKIKYLLSQSGLNMTTIESNCLREYSEHWSPQQHAQRITTVLNQESRATK
ncbi:MAG: glycosyltransferase [Candidatus Nanopelagicales bacterium]